ncbi:MAG: type I glyceraldehyde-3-phosphate dehydrogenase [Methanobacteriota archaeon]|nr:MAG: type I glyceraldehyde-3-phosphate dehydrogenase [Euryarchaeota archaeon]
MVKIGINGFGRIGRNAFRAAIQKEGYGGQFEIVAVNDIAPVDSLAYLLKWDSVYGKLGQDVASEDGALVVGGRTVQVTQHRSPADIPWRSFGVDVVIESTGLFTAREKAAEHLTGGARKVIISAPSKDSDATVVLGVNLDAYDRERHHVVSNASCTTNSLAPPAKVINDAFSIVEGMMTTVHAYTGDQRVVDLPHKDFRRGRAAALSIIPTTTGAAKAIGMVIPELSGKLNGFALRVPTPCGSVTDLTFSTEEEMSRETLNAALAEAASGPMKGIMEFCEEPIVSSDVVRNPHSSIIDAQMTMVIGVKGRFGKILSWYDNEWGYANRLVELAPKLL